MTGPTVDVDALPPTQYLMLDVLAARHRLGEELWTFPTGSAYRTAADQLAKLGLVGWKGGVVPKTIRVWLTDAGRAAVLSDTYELPNQRGNPMNNVRDDEDDRVLAAATAFRQARQGRPYDQWEWLACSQDDVDRARNLVRDLDAARAALASKPECYVCNDQPKLGHYCADCGRQA